MFNKFIWYIKQLFPLTYATDYLEDGQRKVCYWKMRFGHCYDINTFNVSD